MIDSFLSMRYRYGTSRVRGKAAVMKGRKGGGIVEVGRQIRKYREEMVFSQEQLAERIYVSRQTVSNWETGKSYPDINSLLLLSALFHVSLDTLIKGDVETMKEKIKESEIKKFNRYGIVYAVLLLASVFSIIPLVSWIGFYAFIPWGILFFVTMYFAIRLERMKKDNNIYTYKEIVAFTEGRRLDETEQQQENGKRPYQRAFLWLGSAVLGAIIGALMSYIFWR